MVINKDSHLIQVCELLFIQIGIISLGGLCNLHTIIRFQLSLGAMNQSCGILRIQFKENIPGGLLNGGLLSLDLSNL